MRKLHPYILQSREEDMDGEATTMTTTTAAAAEKAEREEEARVDEEKGTRVENSGLGADARECESSLEENSDDENPKAIDEDADEDAAAAAAAKGSPRGSSPPRATERSHVNDKSTDVTASLA